jgi:predicted RNA-binding protein with TRAM domain
MSQSPKQRKKSGRRRCHGEGSNRCPLVLGDELEVNITDISPSGDGMSKIQGFFIHVHNSKPRERVKIRVTKVGEKAATGEIIK